MHKSYFKRLSPELQQAILLHLAEHKGSQQPISVASFTCWASAS
jgi:hypothetical protein